MCIEFPAFKFVSCPPFDCADLLAEDEMVQQMGIDRNVKGTEMVMERIFGSCESFFVTDTVQFDDYFRYVAPRFDPEAKKERHKKQFPLDCRKPYELGARLVREWE